MRDTMNGLLRIRPRWILVAGLAVTLVSADLNDNATATDDATAASSTATATAESIATTHLPNVWRIHAKVLSGGQPDGSAGFAELQKLGVKTVITVDGARPDVETARQYGLKYVHLPHSYDGISDERVLDLAKAIRDLPGPVYVHCHHGKHRSPAAAAAGCIAAGMIPPESAHDILKTAGTSEHYRGLYESVEETRPVAAKQLDDRPANFPEVADLPPMAEAMVEIEHAFARMKSVKEAGWKPPADHPDIDPPHEALLLRELFTELARTDDVRKRPAKFRQYVQTSEKAGVALEAALRASRLAEAKTQLDHIAKACVDCHAEFRDVPQDESQ